MADAEREHAVGRHQQVFVRTHQVLEEGGVIVERLANGYLQGGPQTVA